MKELLVPVGSMDSLKVAVLSGADAIYLGGSFFGARAFAGNFDNNEIIEAIKYAHLYKVKVYVTVNTLIYESELERAFDYCKFLHENGVDALIMQDLGLINLVRNRLPNLDIHASTQMHNTNQSTINFLESIGVKRVVLARELSLEDINNLTTTMEIEVFIHGAICICYSGECLLSKMVLNRSGNRGKCAQLCRLPYTLVKNNEEIKTDGNYLLSPKELCTIFDFDKILESNITSLKIEGRMKSPEYVGCVTRLYRTYIDKHIIDKEILKDLQVIFNRDFTNGFLFNTNDLMSTNKPNHRGIRLGEVINVTHDFIAIKLELPVHQGDGIRFSESDIGFNLNYLYDSKKNLVNFKDKGDIVYIKNTLKTHVGEEIRKTSDVEVTKKYLSIDKKISVNMEFIAKKNNNIILIVRDDTDEIKIEGPVASEAITHPITLDNIKKCLSKTGNTPFIVDNFIFNVDKDIFINLKDLNILRRQALDKLKELRENKKKEVVINNYESSVNNQEKIEGISALVRTEEQLIACLDSKIKRIYTPNITLYNKYKDKIYLRQPRSNNTCDIKKSLATKTGDLLISKYSDVSLNVTNHESMYFLSNYVDLITLSHEVSDEELVNISPYLNNINVEKIVYGRVEVMILKHCILKDIMNKDKICNVCFKDNYYLKSQDGKMYPIVTDPTLHLTHILDSNNLNFIDKIVNYKKLGINNFRLEFFLEDYNQVINLLKQANIEINK